MSNLCGFQMSWTTEHGAIHCNREKGHEGNHSLTLPFTWVPLETDWNRFFRLIEAKLVAYNIQYADDFVGALKSLHSSPQRETILALLKTTAKML